MDAAADVVVAVLTLVYAAVPFVLVSLGALFRPLDAATTAAAVARDDDDDDERITADGRCPLPFC